MQKFLSAVDRKIEELTHESCRKSVHALIAFVPLLCAWNQAFPMVLLGLGIVIYTWSEVIRLEGGQVFIISSIMNHVHREKEATRFVLAPLTLACGTIFALNFYTYDAMCAAVYILAFSDSFACLAGKCFGREKIPFTHGKTYVGSAACFIVSFIIVYRISGGNIAASVFTALAATMVEMLPAGDFDNLLIPITSGFIFQLFL